ncbi:thioredoxin family protein [Ferruginibacter lapsinanis]|uniref:thioredoxin family protein n=1 Tax=Ferruginibacter lapsinanis TaxID=563172 RepID=UPI001E57D79F|nr:thioredoxin family protein [Ferruginibacter lapsinanis]UEG49914.1 thioredoxin family protein [Ferruginibacter lapsinanis]
MKIFATMLLATMMFTGTTNWLTNFTDAQKIAKEKKQFIVLNFSGSDWCGPCIRMKREIFGSDEFNAFAVDNLVLVNADFPRNKKNKLAKAQVKLNEALADKYNPEGKFPFTLLLDAEGKVVKKWDGFPNVKPEDFVASIKAVINADK